MKAQGFLARHQVETKARSDAKKQKQGREEALALARSVDKIITVKGKNFVTLDLKKDKPDEAMLLSALLGPSGNLRAPTFRKGKTLMVGFHPDAYESLLSK